MTTTLRDFIASREIEIRDLQKALKLEFRELQLAKAALDGQQNASSSVSTSGPTIKEMARELLSNAPKGLTSAGVLEGIKKSFGRDIERTSLSPQLSRLKDDGELVLEGEVWLSRVHHEGKLAKTWDQAGEVISRQAAQMPDDEGVPENPDWDDNEDPPF